MKYFLFTYFTLIFFYLIHFKCKFFKSPNHSRVDDSAFRIAGEEHRHRLGLVHDEAILRRRRILLEDLEG